MLIIGITGGTGSGKTTIVNQIIKELPKCDVGVISQDSYYKDTPHLSQEERNAINFDHPHAIDFKLLIQHIKDLKAGKTIKQPTYSFVNHSRTGDEIITPPKQVMIIEGILILAHEELRSLFDITFFVHTDSDERLIRRLKRDVSERGRNVDSILVRYQSTLKPMHEKFIEPTRAFADIIIPNNNYNTIAINIIKIIIIDKLK